MHSYDVKAPVRVEDATFDDKIEKNNVNGVAPLPENANERTEKSVDDEKLVVADEKLAAAEEKVNAATSIVWALKGRDTVGWSFYSS